MPSSGQDFASLLAATKTIAAEVAAKHAPDVDAKAPLAGGPFLQGGVTRRAYEGRHVMRPLTHERIARAAKALKLPAPMPLKRAGA